MEVEGEEKAHLTHFTTTITVAKMTFYLKPAVVPAPFAITCHTVRIVAATVKRVLILK
jgi:hypothetical protein